MEKIKRDIKYLYGSVAEFCREEKINYAKMSLMLNQLRTEGVYQKLLKEVKEKIQLKKNAIHNNH